MNLRKLSKVMDTDYGLSTKDIQNLVLEKTGIKVSVKKGAGSERGYFIFTPMFQNGAYPKIPIEFARELVKQYPGEEPHPNFASNSQILFYDLTEDSTKFKTEHKPKSVEEMSVRTWGSKNSQLRLDKASARHAKAVAQGKDTVRYW